MTRVSVSALFESAVVPSHFESSSAAWPDFLDYLTKRCNGAELRSVFSADEIRRCREYLQAIAAGKEVSPWFNEFESRADVLEAARKFVNWKQQGDLVDNLA
jgi:hypothetical protein